MNQYSCFSKKTLSLFKLHKRKFYLKNTAMAVFFSFILVLGIDSFHHHDNGHCEDGCTISITEYSFFDYFVPAAKTQHENGCCVICTSLRNYTKEYSNSIFKVNVYSIVNIGFTFLNEALPPFYKISSSSRSPPLNL